MNPEDRLTELLRLDAESYQPGDARSAIGDRVRVRRRARKRRHAAVPILLVVIVAALVPLALTAGSTTRRHAADTTSPGHNAVSSTSNPTSYATSTTQPLPGNCLSSNLTASGVRGADAIDDEGVVVVFRNAGPTACSLSGYPSAWFVDASGAQVGAMSTPWASLAEGDGVVVLSPGGTASTTVWSADPTALPSGSRCGSTTVDGLRVVPPGQSTSIAAQVAISVCATDSVVGTLPVRSSSTETSP